MAHGLDLPYWEIVTDRTGASAGGADPHVNKAGEAQEPGEDIVAYDVSRWSERKIAALRSHATQLTVDGDAIVHVGGQRQPIDVIERFRRLPRLG